MRIALFGLVLSMMLLPAITLAQDTGLVPCGNQGQEQCTTNDVVAFVNGLITFLITMLGVIAVIVMVYAGFKMVTSAGDEAAWTKAKELFGNVIIGIILILAAWLIVDTLLKLLTNRGLNEWSGELAMTVPDPGRTSIVGGGSAGAGKYTDAEAREALAAAGISVNKTEAQGTSLHNINQATVREAIAFKQSCGCTVVFTGGTESGIHASGTYSHGNGYKFDMRRNSEVDSYITRNYTYIGPRSGDGALMYRSAGGQIYAKESDHWDVLVR